MTSTRSTPSVGMMEGSVLGVVGDAVPVDQHERRVRTDATQVDGVAVGDVAGAAGLGAGVLAHTQVEVLRDFLDDAIDGDFRRCSDRFAVQRDDRGTDRLRAPHATARDRDFLDFHFVGGCSICCDRRQP